MSDLVIIGGGPGGYGAAIRASQEGLRVVLIEKDTVGGTCLNRGCIPLKSLLAGSKLATRVNSGGILGLKFKEATVDWGVLQVHKETAVSKLLQGLKGLLFRHNVEIIYGAGHLLRQGRVAVKTDSGEEIIEAQKGTILAMGSEPLLPEFMNYDGQTIISSNEALELTAVPESILIIGGGVVGCEFASLYRGLGSKVIIIETLPSILPELDREMSRRAQGLLRRQGIEIKVKSNIKRLMSKGGRAVAILDSGEEIVSEKAIIAIGRRLNTQNLDTVGVALGQKGEVKIDNFMRTSLQNVYAVGDVTSKIQTAHVALAQGLAAVAHIIGKPRTLEYQVVPKCIYTFPEIASVGLTEEEAIYQGIQFQKAIYPFSANGRAVAFDEAEGLIKIIAEIDNGRLLGVHLIGPHVTELVAEASLSIQQKLTVDQVASTIHAHPSLSEAFAEACEAVHNRAIHI